jgi:hypothetical protein
MVPPSRKAAQPQQAEEADPAPIEVIVSINYVLGDRWCGGGWSLIGWCLGFQRTGTGDQESYS